MAAATTILQHRYRIVRELGRGGMGMVFEAFDIRLSRTVALKETLGQTSDLHQAFKHEARLLANLRHPSLPNILDHFIEGDGQFLVMEFIAGTDLSQMLLRRGGPFPVQQALRWGDEILSVLEYLHNQTPPVIHRDIKPANLKLDAGGHIILLDFGLAKGFAGTMTNPITSRSVAGYSPHYAPLEQMHGEKSDPRGDLYATAATLYHLMTGHVPDEALKRASSVFSDLPDPLLPANQYNPEIPVAVAQALAQALSLRIHERPRNASAMKAALNQAFFAETIGATQPGPPSSSNSRRYVDAAYQTIPGKPELVLDPFAVASSTHSTEAASSKGKWFFSIFLGCALIAALYLLHRSRQVGEPETSRTAAASPPEAPAIPAPYSRALASVVLVEMSDAEGKSVGQASGFFVKEDEIATDLSALQGATQGRATQVTQHTTFNISGVTAVDRERGLAILKVEGGKGPPLPAAAVPLTTGGTKVAILSASSNGEGAYSEATITEYRKKDDRLEVSDTVNTVGSGSVVLNDHGDVVAILKGSTDGAKSKQAIPAARLVALKRQQPIIPLGVAGAKEVLYDFRQQDDSNSSEAEQNKFSPELARKVLPAVFKSYLTNEDQCSDFEGNTSNPEGLREARAAGYIVPAIVDVATGSFTAPGLQQTAYLITVGECGAPHVVNWGTKRLAVFTGQTLVLNVDVQDHTAILGTYDLNKDGIDELLLTGGYMQSGLMSEWGALISVQDARLQFVKKFNSVRDNSCSSMEPKSGTGAAVIYYTRGAGAVGPEFRIDNYQAKCTDGSDTPKPSEFRYVSSAKASKP
jgi:serine/threonine protein kinase